MYSKKHDSYVRILSDKPETVDDKELYKCRVLSSAKDGKDEEPLEELIARDQLTDSITVNVQVSGR